MNWWRFLTGRSKPARQSAARPRVSLAVEILEERQLLTLSGWDPRWLNAGAYASQSPWLSTYNPTPAPQLTQAGVAGTVSGTYTYTENGGYDLAVHITGHDLTGTFTLDVTGHVNFTWAESGQNNNGTLANPTDTQSQDAQLRYAYRETATDGTPLRSESGSDQFTAPGLFADGAAGAGFRWWSVTQALSNRHGLGLDASTWDTLTAGENGTLGYTYNEIGTKTVANDTNAPALTTGGTDTYTYNSSIDYTYATNGGGTYQLAESGGYDPQNGFALGSVVYDEATGYGTAYTENGQSTWNGQRTSTDTSSAGASDTTSYDGTLGYVYNQSATGSYTSHAEGTYAGGAFSLGCVLYGGSGTFTSDLSQNGSQNAQSALTQTAPVAMPYAQATTTMATTLSFTYGQDNSGTYSFGQQGNSSPLGIAFTNATADNDGTSSFHYAETGLQSFTTTTGGPATTPTGSSTETGTYTGQTSYQTTQDGGGSFHSHQAGGYTSLTAMSLTSYVYQESGTTTSAGSQTAAQSWSGTGQSQTTDTSDPTQTLSENNTYSFGGSSTATSSSTGSGTYASYQAGATVLGQLALTSYVYSTSSASQSTSATQGSQSQSGDVTDNTQGGGGAMPVPSSTTPAATPGTPSTPAAPSSDGMLVPSTSTPATTTAGPGGTTRGTQTYHYSSASSYNSSDTGQASDSAYYAGTYNVAASGYALSSVVLGSSRSGSGSAQWNASQSWSGSGTSTASTGSGPSASGPGSTSSATSTDTNTFADARSTASAIAYTQAQSSSYQGTYLYGTYTFPVVAFSSSYHQSETDTAAGNQSLSGTTTSSTTQQAVVAAAPDGSAGVAAGPGGSSSSVQQTTAYASASSYAYTLGSDNTFAQSWQGTYANGSFAYASVVYSGSGSNSYTQSSTGHDQRTTTGTSSYSGPASGVSSGGSGSTPNPAVNTATSQTFTNTTAGDSSSQAQGSASASVYGAGSWAAGDYSLSSYVASSKRSDSSSATGTGTSAVTAQGSYANSPAPGIGGAPADSGSGTFSYSCSGTFTEVQSAKSDAADSRSGSYANGSFAFGSVVYDADASAHNAITSSGNARRDATDNVNTTTPGSSLTGQSVTTTRSSLTAQGSTDGSWQAHEEGTYAAGAFNLSCYAYDYGGAQSSQSSETARQTGSGGGTLTTTQGSGLFGAFSSGLAAFAFGGAAGGSTQSFATANNQTFTANSSAASSYTVSQLGTYSGGALHLSSYVQTSTATGHADLTATANTTASGSGSSNGSGGSGGGVAGGIAAGLAGALGSTPPAMASASSGFSFTAGQSASESDSTDSSMNFYQAGSFDNGQYNLSSVVYDATFDVSQQVSQSGQQALSGGGTETPNTTSGTGAAASFTYSASATGSAKSSALGHYTAHEEGTYQNGAYALSSVAYVNHSEAHASASQSYAETRTGTGYSYAESDSAKQGQDGTGDSSAAGQYAPGAGLSLSSYTATNVASATGRSSQAISWSNADGNGNSASQDFSTTVQGSDSATQHEEGSYAGGQLSLSCFVADRADSLACIGHDTGSTKSSPANGSFSYASGYTNDSDTSNTQAVHEEGTYAAGSWSLSCYVLDQGSLSGSDNQQSGSSTTPEGTSNSNSDQQSAFNQTLHEEGTYAAGQLTLTAHHRIADTASSGANESAFSGPSFSYDNTSSSNNTVHEDETGSGTTATDTVTTSGSTTGPGPNGTPVTNSYATVNTYTRPIGGTLFLTPSVLFVAPSPVLTAANGAASTSSGGSTGSTNGTTGGTAGGGSSAGLAGNTTTVTRDGVTFVTVTDAAGRVLSITGTDSSGAVVEYHAYTYDAAGNVLTQRDGSNTTAYGYDGAGRKTSETVAYGTPQAATTTYAYDDAGNLVQVTDPDGNVTKFTYDPSNRLISTTDPLGHTETRGYDSAGRLGWVVSRDGLKRAFAYDDGGRLLTETWYAADGITVTDTLAYSYDGAGRLLTASNGYGRYTFSYDAQGRLASVQEPVGLTLTFGYDAQGNRVLVQDSLGGVTQSVYNAAKQLVQRLFSASGDPSLQVNLAYDDAGRLSAITRQTGTTATGTTAYAYDYDGRLLELQDSTGGGMPLFDYRYSFDTAGQLTGESLNGTTTSYNYDPAGQLSSDGIAGYAYDASGNRDTSGYVIGPGNQILSDGTWRYTYDADGNVIAKVNLATGETWQYRFDTIDHLTHAELRSADGTLEASADFKYDVFGNRIEMDVDTGGGVQVTKFALDGWDPAKPAAVGNANWDVYADLNADGTLQTHYLRGDAVDQLFARLGSDGQAYWYLTDHLGSIRAVVNAAGGVVDAITYSGFGQIIAETAPQYRGRFAWTGRELDTVTGLQYNHDRYYDPSTGRWMGQDPMGFAAGDSDLYRYAANRPTEATDPSGDFGLVQIAVGAWALFNGRNPIWAINDFHLNVANGFINAPADLINALGQDPRGVIRQAVIFAVPGALLQEILFNGPGILVQAWNGIAENPGRFLGQQLFWALLGRALGGVGNLPRPRLPQPMPQLAPVGVPIPVGAPAVAVPRPLLPPGVGPAAAVPGAVAQAANGGDPNPAPPNGPRPREVQGQLDFENGGARFPDNIEVPSVRNGAFQRWFNSLTPEELERLWQNPATRDAIEMRLRAPGGFHEWLPVSRAPRFRQWGITAEQIQELRTPTSEIRWQAGGAHGGLNSTTMHNEILALVDSSPDYATFVRRLREWADRRLVGGRAALPPGLR